MERGLLLQILDTAWKEHLLAMDHLRSSVGLRGYAQVDPKVEYKREGMRMFEQMWDSVGAYVTDLVFKMEQLDERFVKSTGRKPPRFTRKPHKPTSASNSEPLLMPPAEDRQAKLDADPHRGERGRSQCTLPCGSGKSSNSVVCEKAVRLSRTSVLAPKDARNMHYRTRSLLVVLTVAALFLA